MMSCSSGIISNWKRFQYEILNSDDAADKNMSKVKKEYKFFNI